MKQLMRSHPDDWGIMELQNCILNIAEYIDQFCNAHDIFYCLMGGSALGALRHKGFIPWDDDLDIFMTPDNFDRFRDVFYKEGDKDRFYLQQFGNKGRRNGLVSMAKLRMNGTTYIEEYLEGRKMHQGIFVDIFILHACPDNNLKRNWQYFWAKYIVAKALAHKHYARHGKLLQIALTMLTIFPRHFLIDYALRQVYRYRNDATEYLCHFLGRAWKKNGLYKREYFNSTRHVPFETVKLAVPKDCELYLQDRWGDYMKLPSKEEIAYFQHSHNWSTTEPFQGYNKGNIYPDEKKLIV